MSLSVHHRRRNLHCLQSIDRDPTPSVIHYRKARFKEKQKKITLRKKDIPHKWIPYTHSPTPLTRGSLGTDCATSSRLSSLLLLDALLVMGRRRAGGVWTLLFRFFFIVLLPEGWRINSLQTGEVDVSLDSIAHPRAIFWWGIRFWGQK